MRIVKNAPTMGRPSAGRIRRRLRLGFAAIVTTAAAAAIAAAPPQAPAALSSPSVAPLGDLKLPSGFAISVFASDLAGARMMAVSPEGVLLVARRRTSEVVALPDWNNDGVAEPAVVLANLTNAHSVAFKDGYLYVATTPAVMRVRWRDGKPDGQPEVFAELPSSTPALHVSRTLGVGKDGRLYVSIGSSCNICLEPDPRRMTIQVFNADGRLEPYAIGLRNAIGFDWDPQTGRMFSTDAGQDGSGDAFPPDEINMIEPGKHYGFPFFVAANQANAVPELKDVAATVTAAQAVAPALMLPPHTTGIDLRFYTGTQFPASFRNALFVSLHGSTTIPEKVGYKVVRVVMKNGLPVGLEDFITGWLKDGVVSGRPAGLMTGRDGALYVSDDNKGFIYRVSYGGK